MALQFYLPVRGSIIGTLAGNSQRVRVKHIAAVHDGRIHGRILALCCRRTGLRAADIGCTTETLTERVIDMAAHEAHPITAVPVGPECRNRTGEGRRQRQTCVVDGLGFDDDVLRVLLVVIIVLVLDIDVRGRSGPRRAPEGAPRRSGACSGRHTSTVAMLALLLLISTAEHSRYCWLLVTVRGPADRRVYRLDEAAVLPGAEGPRRRRHRCGWAVGVGRSQGDALETEELRVRDGTKNRITGKRREEFVSVAVLLRLLMRRRRDLIHLCESWWRW